MVIVVRGWPHHHPATAIYPEIPRSTTVFSLHSSLPHGTRHRQGLGVLKATVNDSREARQDERRACRARSVSTIEGHGIDRRRTRRKSNWQREIRVAKREAHLGKTTEVEAG